MSFSKLSIQNNGLPATAAENQLDGFQFITVQFYKSQTNFKI